MAFIQPIVSAVDPPTALHLGVGVDPGSLDFARAVDRLREKVETGAEFVITQPVFRPAVLFRMLDASAPFLATSWCSRARGLSRASTTPGS